VVKTGSAWVIGNDGTELYKRIYACAANPHLAAYCCSNTDRYSHSDRYPYAYIKPSSGLGSVVLRE
jgi:hypothetical protein